MIAFTIECPVCETADNTFAVPDTAYSRMCWTCLETFDIRPDDLIAEDALYV